MSKFRITIFFGSIGLVVLIAIVSFVLLNDSRNEDIIYGATISTVYSQELGLDPAEVFEKSIDELGIDHFRIPVYWSEVELEQDVYNFEDVDKIINIATEKDVKITLAIGQKVPRWPECFIPDWIERKSLEDRDRELMDFIGVVVRRYRNEPAIIRWQIENESFFPFGECPKPNPRLIQKEIDFVRGVDDRPIQLTTSGEQAFWVFRALPADVVGVSLYRRVHNENFGEILFPYTPRIYDIQRRLASLFADKVIVSELQAEPWGLGQYTYPDSNGLDAAYESFTIDDLQENLNFARRTGVDEVYLWGIEWWYFLKTNGDSRLWDGAVELLK